MNYLMSQPKPLPGRSARALSDLDATQVDSLAALRSDNGDAVAMLTSLTMANSLVELSKLAMARLSLVEFSTAALNTLAQCAPVESLALTLTPEDLPPVASTVGLWPTSRDGSLLDPGVDTDPEHAVAPLYGLDPGHPIGFLGIGGAPRELVIADFPQRTAEHLSSMLAMLIERERLRRAAAASHALELVSALDDSFGEEQLAEITDAVHLLPGAYAATLTLELPRFAGPIVCHAGVARTDVEPIVRNEAIGARGTITLTLWSAEHGSIDQRLDEIIDRLLGSIARAETTVQLREELETDALTGLGNRRRASRALAQARQRCARDAEQYAVLLMDLDKFKAVNDTYGHEVGDRVLTSFASTVQSALRTFDVAARWGGEEFLIVCPGTGAAEAAELAEQIRAATPEGCAGAFPEERHQTVSIGIAVVHSAARDPLEHVKRADEALYRAKSGGRDRYELADEKLG